MDVRVTVFLPEELKQFYVEQSKMRVTSTMSAVIRDVLLENAKIHDPEIEKRIIEAQRAKK